jgi:hypothetical protein
VLLDLHSVGTPPIRLLRTVSTDDQQLTGTFRLVWTAGSAVARNVMVVEGRTSLFTQH